MTTQPTLNSPGFLLAKAAREPLLIDAASSDVLRAALEHVATMPAEAADGAFASGDFWRGDEHPYRPYIVKDGVLQIPVQGVLLHRFPYQFGGWATGYDYIEKALERGLGDSSVRGIALVVDSPGGEVAGCFELSDKIYESRGTKPIRAFSADSAYSAAYALASAADDITVTRSGGTGSVGVVTAHVDYSGALGQMGVKVTFIFAGAHKVDGNAYEALPEAVKERIQTRIDKLYGVFTSTVARNRNIGEDAVRDTQALCYDATDSLEVGFADRIGALDDETARFAQELNNVEHEHMTTQNQTPDVAANEAAANAARAEGRTEGAAAERGRIVAILGSEEAKTRPAAAMAAALETDMSADTAKAFLAKLPEEKAAVPAPAPNGFNGRMDNSPNPDVGADTSGADGGEAPKASAGILASTRAARGIAAAPRKQ